MADRGQRHVALRTIPAWRTLAPESRKGSLHQTRHRKDSGGPIAAASAAVAFAGATDAVGGMRVFRGRWLRHRPAVQDLRGRGDERLRSRRTRPSEARALFCAEGRPAHRRCYAGPKDCFRDGRERRARSGQKVRTEWIHVSAEPAAWLNRNGARQMWRTWEFPCLPADGRPNKIGPKEELFSQIPAPPCELGEDRK